MLATRRKWCVAMVLLLACLCVAWPLRGEGEDASPEIKPERNIYLAPSNLTAEQLQQYIVKMKAKPESIQRRPGFADAIAEASERLLKLADKGSDAETQALLQRFRALHVLADNGDKAAGDQLQALAEANQIDPRDDVQYEATFHRLEAKVAQADDIPADKLAPLLDEVKTFLQRKPLETRHLTLASGTVRMINRLPEDNAAAEAYKTFGSLLAASADGDVATYGRQIQKALKASSLIGQPMELAGHVVDGQDFSWDTYRGKVVLVEFWATWCGPCRAVTPHIKATREKFRKQGFDVVGVSLDTDRAALTEYLEQEEITWENILGEEGAGGWSHPLAEKYQVQGIPANFLVDKEGKIVAQNLFGEELDARLAKLLAPPEDEKAKP